METQVASVVLADDHVLYRESLRGLFERWPEFEVVGEASSGKEALELCEAFKPDLVVMDVSMPQMGGLEVVPEVVEKHNSVVVMLSAELKEEHLIAAFKNGARGYLLKNIHSYQLRAKLNDALQGDMVLSGEAIELCLDLMRSRRDEAFGRKAQEGALASLSDQDQQILKYVALGESNKEIGERLGLGESTVKKRFSIILAKLDLENRVQAAVFALRVGLLR